MSTITGPGGLSDPAADLRPLIVSVCDRFAAAWKSGESPRLEEYLDSGEVPPSRRATLLGSLLEVEREQRQARGEHPHAVDYVERFPSYGYVVRTAFGDDRIGDYDLIDAIGEGAMGVVYRAQHREMRRIVALKMIRPNRLDDSATVDRFRLEAQIAARLEHEHIVPVYEAGQDGGQHFYTMRYISGRSLAEVIDGRPLENLRAAHFLEQVARAVDHAHTRYVLHRDLKPRNILIGAEDNAFVADFGMAKVLGEARGVTMTGDWVGTPSYMSPEQIRDPSHAGVLSDVYSLGATLFEALTGRPPFRGGNVMEIMERIGRDEPAAPRSLNPACPRDLETICLKCLEKEPARRYASAQELAEDLRRFLEGESIKARRISPLERARKWTRRHKALAALGGVTLVAVIALVGVATLRRALADSEQGYRQARVVVDEVAQFGERRLRDHPHLLKELIEILLREHGDFLARHRNDPKYASEAAQTLTRMARLMNLVGSRDAALKAHEQALQLRRAIASSDPEDEADLAETLHDLGILHNDLGNNDEAIADYREALAIRGRLVALRPANREFLSDLARSYGYIGDWERQNNRAQAARASYLKAEQIRERLVRTDRNDLVAKFQLARSYNNSGFLERERGERARSAERHTQAAKLQAELVAVNRGVARRLLDNDKRNFDISDSDFQADLAFSYSARGVVRRELGQTDLALGDSEQAIKLFEDLVAAHPGTTNFQSGLASAYSELGIVRSSKGDYLRAAKDLARAQSLVDALVVDNPGVTLFRASQARNRAARGALALRSGGDADDGRALLISARTTQRSLVRAHPGNFDYRQQLNWTVQALEKSSD